jgi:hypothetical protein
MALRFNGIEIPTTGEVHFGGVSFNEVRFNGVSFWIKGGLEVPPVPSFCDASDDAYEDYIRVQWGYSHYEAGYAVYRSEDGADFVKVTTITNGNLWYDDYNVEQGITYSYKVKACWLDDFDSCSGFSEVDDGTVKAPEVIDPPANAPESLTASDGNYHDKIVITWNNGNELEATAVNIYRDNILISIVEFGTTMYTDIAVETGTSYTYKACFKNSSGEGPFSSEDEGSTATASPYVLKAGDTMTGPLEISDLSPYLELTETNSSGSLKTRLLQSIDKFTISVFDQADDSLISNPFSILYDTFSNAADIPAMYCHTDKWEIKGNLAVKNFSAANIDTNDAVINRYFNINDFDDNPGGFQTYYRNKELLMYGRNENNAMENIEIRVAGKISASLVPVNDLDLTNKEYVDSRINHIIEEELHDETNNRLLDTDYTNQSGKTLTAMVSIHSQATADAGGDLVIVAIVNGIRIEGTLSHASVLDGYVRSSITIVVPKGGTYSITSETMNVGDITLDSWLELI